MEPSLHVVFGAGQVGGRLAERLAARGLRVRVVRRSAAKAAAGIETLSGDAAGGAGKPLHAGPAGRPPAG